MSCVKEGIISIFSFVVKLVVSLFKGIGLWFLSIILGIYRVLKSIVLGIFYLVFKTSIKQKLFMLLVVVLLGGGFVLSRINDLDAKTLEHTDRETQLGELIDLNYQRLKDEEKYIILYDQADYMVKMDLTTTNIEILNKKTNITYNTLASAGSSEALKTPFTITYKLKDSNSTQTLNAMNQSVKEGSYEVYEIDHGVRVDYTIGDSKYSLKDLPSFIAPDKFEEKILNVVSEESKELINKYYKYSKDRDVYYPSNPKSDSRLVYEIIFYEGEYTFEDLSDDIYKYTGKDEAKHPKGTFTFPIEYTFENGTLNVNVLFQSALIPDEFQVVTMDLLPSFGATLNGESSYALLPDGSGGIVELNGVKGTNNVYIKSLYNNSELLESPVKRFDELATMPVYGMTSETQGFLAIVDQGAEKTNLVLTVSNDENEPSRIFPRIQNVDTYNHDFYGDGSLTIKYYSENKTSEYRIQYHLLDESNNDYFSMANLYREYLVNTYGLTVQDDISSGILVDMIGGIKKEQNVMGIQFDKVEYATTYQQVIKILEELKTVKNLTTVYTGWMNGGYTHDLPTQIKYDQAAGGKSEFESLVSYLNDNEVNHYFDISFIETYRKNDNGFRATEHGITNVPNEVLKRQDVKPNTLLEDKTSLVKYFVSPQYLNSVVDRYLKNQEFELSGLSLRNIGSLYYANYGRKGVEFTYAKQYVEEALQTLTEAGYQLLMKDGYNYTFPYSSYQTNIPLETTYNGVIDYSIPFKQIAYNGFFDYSGESVNIENATSVEKNLLKAVEFGMDVKYTVSYEDSSFFNNTDYTYYYHTTFDDLKDDIFETSKVIEESKQVIGNGHIVGHERLMNDVYRVTYENGKTLIFNYNNEGVNVGGKMIPALDYIVE
ncbi:conserved domain protein [Turicibacter sp. HGF1]|uniref:DUF5696 domain-containing protein n=1 Tax=Turicibacter sp. HGF1 TaxID=910310 RepID=UPI0001FD88CC|nr:DUF5696 domain-containing protein [Turicibacter sp. HGF1]EGC90893.1 conserved domain protein [Turicibacter sp. HGF1]